MNISLYLLGIIVLAFMAQLTVPGFTQTFYFDPSTALSQPWTFVTSIFLHGGFIHLFFNGYALFLFGSILERVVPKKEYFIGFFGAGIFGSILYYLVIIMGVAAPVPALGASGAIFGIMGMLTVLLPDMVIYIWFLPLRMREAAIFWIFLEFVGTFNMASGVASAAHLGGLVFGILYAKYLVSRQGPPVAYY
ncbi:MAG: rhomboid family intramembrane serine protease [Candidatus Bilamarchaeaceae archaeon]